MIEQVVNILQQDCKIHEQGLLIVGVSGGPDSLFLLNVLYECGYNLVVVHINHKLRPEADEEAQYVRQAAAQIGVDCVVWEVDVLGFAEKHKIAIEEAARRLRYQHLFDQAQQRSASAVLVGHTADDQVETILMHLLRGSGLVGLRGMQTCTLPNSWSEHIPLVRPLLFTWRSDILQYLAEKQIQPAFDQTNLDTAYYRNRVRYDLLPQLEEYAPRLRQNLLRLGQILSDDYQLIQRQVDIAWTICLLNHEQGYLAFHRPNFERQLPSVQRYLLRRAIEGFVPGLTDVGFECIERGRKFIAENKPSGQVDLLDGMRLIRDVDVFWLTSGDDLPISAYPQLKPDETIAIPIPGRSLLKNSWVLETEMVADNKQAIEQEKRNNDRYQAWFDMDKISLPLVLRSRESGDRIHPAGMDGHSIKISDLMINQKLPLRARKNWPLICCGDKIVWVPGYRQSGLATIDKQSTSIAHLILVRKLST
ncbi:MAG: tRNA lysidine(34) synthetase TilS [Anaerolineae bacterium]|nr:tRNA lysidine(34) synthetase TilS [Anaerolineae bacterium]